MLLGSAIGNGRNNEALQANFAAILEKRRQSLSRTQQLLHVRRLSERTSMDRKIEINGSRSIDGRRSTLF
jgi:hypothetical protein